MLSHLNIFLKNFRWSSKNFSGVIEEIEYFTKFNFLLDFINVKIIEL